MNKINKGSMLSVAAMLLAIASTVVSSYNNTKSMEETVKKEIDDYMSKVVR